MQKYILALVCLLTTSLSVNATDGYIFRLYLKDKKGTENSISHPSAYLSQRALDRRQKQHIAIDSTDLPISRSYIPQIEDSDAIIVAKSKWMNTVCVFTPDSALVKNLSMLPFVSRAEFVWKSPTTEKSSKADKKMKTLQTKPQDEYGYGYEQMKTLNAFGLHADGYKGKGLEIAIIDAGFRNLNDILLLDNVRIRVSKDFVFDGNNIFESSDHGVKVLSILSGNRLGTYIGTAPEASFWLLRSEDDRSEYPVEEDYWVAAAEYADSVGVDVINTSLGYSVFEVPAKNHTLEQLDGKTAFISQAAQKATSKGLFIEASAGNEGNTASWGKIAFPADAVNVLTVGAIDQDSLVASFSSRGFTSDGRIKPDVVALGRNIYVINSRGDIEKSDGTSFSGPVMSGLATCLWQEFPNLTNIELLNIIRKSSHRFSNPNESFGYGIPDIEKARKLARGESSAIEQETISDSGEDFKIQVIDSAGHLKIISEKPVNGQLITIYSLNGKILLQEKFVYQEQDLYLPHWLDTTYIISVKGNKYMFSKKIKL